MSTTTTASGLVIEEIALGDGDEAQPGRAVSVHYTGWLTNGTKFDSSVDRDEPFEFPLGRGYVIRGWDEGVAGMKVGGKRKLTIPPDLGYGPRGAGGVIPPNATLVFEVQLLAVRGRPGRPHGPPRPFNPASMLRHRVFRIWMRAAFLSLAGTRVQGAISVLVRSTRSQTASS